VDVVRRGSGARQLHWPCISVRTAECSQMGTMEGHTNSNTSRRR
jgi:hypothetical protein